MNMLTERFYFALQYATHLHRDQKRKGRDVPYVSHLLGVASLVLEYGGDEDEAIGALLHDVIEDQDVTAEEITRIFGPRVAEIVEGCTDGVPDAVTGEKPAWRPRKEAYIAHVDGSKSTSIRLVSAADKLHNTRAITADYRILGDALWSRFSGGREMLWYLRALSDKFQQVTPADAPANLRALLNDLSCAVEDLEELTILD